MACFQIRNGPSKFDLMLSLFDREDECIPRTIRLVLWTEEAGTFEREMRVNSIGWSGKTRLWVVAGELDRGPGSDTIQIDWSKKIAVHGVFSTKDRKGYLDTETE